MSCEIQCPVIVDSVHPAFCHIRQRPIVCYKTRHISPVKGNNYLVMNAVVVEEEEEEEDRLEPGALAFLRATVDHGSDADVDVDVLALTSLDGVDEAHPPCVVSATGEVVGLHADAAGKWVVIEGGDEGATWTLSVSMQECPDNLFNTIQASDVIQVSGPFIGHFQIHHLNGTTSSMPQILPRLLAFPASHVALPFLPPHSSIADLDVVQDFSETTTDNHALPDDYDSSDDADDEEDGFDETDQSDADLTDGWDTPASSTSFPVASKSLAPASGGIDVHASDDEWEVQALVATEGSDSDFGSHLGNAAESEAGKVDIPVAEGVSGDGKSVNGEDEQDLGGELEEEGESSVPELETLMYGSWGYVVDVDAVPGEEAAGVGMASGVGSDENVAGVGGFGMSDVESSPIHSLLRKRRHDVDSGDDEEVANLPSCKRRIF